MAETFDPVLGGQQLAGSDPVMGGLVAVEQALDSPDPKVRIQAIKGALKYGSRGAELVIHALQNDPNWEVQFAAWETLLEAEDPQHVQVAKAHHLPLRQVGNVRARYKAGERDFRWADLRGANLILVNLSEADLRGGNLSRANLSGASLSRANLSRVDLRGSGLSLADLSGVNLIETNLSQADLSGSKLWWADLSGANLIETNLSRADLWRANLSKANLSKADLRGADLRGANLTGAKLSPGWDRFADLSGAILPDGTVHP
ncbi:pentapeptide repeat-containing protein [Synechococcus sp. H70.2]|uniref:pentapeptide repeat-containing protein n=2 Tax=unclassified Synechococcus TaxID=2626047 RepID=UPI0039C2FA19